MTTSVQPRSGEGTIGRFTAWFLTAIFLALILLPVGCQATDRNLASVLGDIPGELWTSGFRSAARSLEARIEVRSAFLPEIRDPYRALALRVLGQTTDGTKIGQDGFLFYHDDLKFVWGQGALSPRQPARITESRDGRGDAFEEAIVSVWDRLQGRPVLEHPSGPHFVSPLTAIPETVRQFRARGVQVLVVVIPGKVMIYPEYYAPSFPLAEGPAQNRDQARWLELLKAEGVDVLDLAPVMWEAKQRSSDLLFLKTDSHWSPAGVAVGADAIAARVEKMLGPPPPCPFTAEQETVAYRGDQLLVLNAINGDRLFPRQTVTLTRVQHGTADDIIGNGAPVLLLGDSYTTMFEGIDPANGAGLPAQLMLRLGRGVQTFASPGIAPATLLHKVSAQPAVLARKKLVIWTFVDRTVVKPKSWEVVPLPAP